MHFRDDDDDDGESTVYIYHASDSNKKFPESVQTSKKTNGRQRVIT